MNEKEIVTWRVFQEFPENQIHGRSDAFSWTREVGEEYHHLGRRGLDSCLVEEHPNMVLGNKDKVDNQDSISDWMISHYHYVLGVG